MTSRAGLTPEEDDELRRLAFLAQFGNTTERLSKRFEELRKRDRRGTVRDPIPAPSRNAGSTSPTGDVLTRADRQRR